MNRPETIDIDMIASRLDGLRRGDGDSDETVQTKPTHYDATRLGIAMDGQSEPIRDEPQPAPEDHAQGPAVAPPPPERPQAEPAALDQPDRPHDAPPRWAARLGSLSDRIGWSAAQQPSRSSRSPR